MKSRIVEIFLHILFWSTTAWLLTNSFSVQFRQLKIIDGIETVNVIRNNTVMWQILKCIAVGAIVFYISFWKIILNKKFKKESIFWLLLFLGIGILFTYLINISHTVPNQPLLPLPISYGIVIFYFTVSVAYGIAKLFYRAQQLQQQILIDKKQTELTLLRNQLQPHFLFNALNNLLSMVEPNKNPKLADSFERLSFLLRYVIEETQSEKVSIQKEISFLKNYVELQKLRFNENEVIVNFSVKGEYLVQKIEPGLYITFVENAFKYGTEPEQKCEIDIHFDLTNKNSIYFKIQNIVMVSNIKSNKTGIETTQKRLGLIYPDKHELNIQQNEKFIVNLKIWTQ
jgi:sensor histidine kinase YesM